MNHNSALAELAQGLAASVRTTDEKGMSYEAAIDLLCQRGAAPKDAAAAIAHGIEHGLFRAEADRLRPP